MTDGESDQSPAVERTVHLKRRRADPEILLDETGHYLLVLNQVGPPQRVLLGSAPLTIGRAAPADLILADGAISRAHCTVVCAGGQLLVTDLRSTNGTLIAGKPISGSATVLPGGRFQIGSQLIHYEQRSRREVEAAEALERDLGRASAYVRSLLPQPIAAGPVRADWFFQPSATLGGDALGYQVLDRTRLAGYLLDVSGHGLGAAMLSVTIMDVLRQRALPGVDFGDPAQVLAGLNAMFPMESHDGLFFTIWYFVYDLATRELTHASAGHHAGYLLAPGRVDPIPLGKPNIAIGMMPNVAFRTERVRLPPGCVLHLFSDGVFEIVGKDGREWTLADFLPLLSRPPQPGMSEPQRLYEAVRDLAAPGPLLDDFSAAAFTFV